MFRIILLCLLTCCSSFMPLKHSESIISEDHTQVVEVKSKRDYFYPNDNTMYICLQELLTSQFHLRLFDIFAGVGGNWFTDFNYHLQSCWDDFQTNRMYGYTCRPEDQNYDTWMFYDFVYQAGSLRPIYTYPDTRSPSVPTITIETKVKSDYYHGYDVNYYNQDDPSISLLSYRVYIQKTNTDNQGFNACVTNINGYKGQYYGTYTDSYLSCHKGDVIFKTMTNMVSGEYDSGYQDGYDNGLIEGERLANSDYYNDGYTAGETAGYITGYNTGVSDTIASGSEAMTIFAGIMDVAFIPVNVFFLMFNYEVFGINIAGFVSGLLTLAIVIILMRFIFGRRV